MTSKRSPKMTPDHSVKPDWNSVAAFGALNSPKIPRSPRRSPTVCRSDPFECTSPHRSPDVKADSEGHGSPIPSHLTLDRRARVSNISSCEGAHGGSPEGSPQSSGFLTPPSRNSSPSHSDHVGARARLPPPMEPVPGKNVVTESDHSSHWLRYPKLHLLDYHLRSYLWLPATKDDPRPAHIESRKPSNFAGSASKISRNKPVSFNFDEVKQSIDRIRSMPVTPAISRRWSSTGLDQAITRGGSITENYVAPERRRTIPFTDRGAEALTAIKERLTRRDIYTHQMETPTIITLRRASAVLGTVAQRQSSMTGDPTPSLPDNWQQACPEVPLAAYLITAEEIHALAALIRRTFADGTPQESSIALETVNEDEQKPRKNKPRSGSTVKRGKVRPEEAFPANVAITVADVHALRRSSTLSRKGSFMSQMSRKTSIVSSMLARKSVHEIIWEDDGKPQSLRSSIWKLSHDPLKNDVATWSSNAFRRESGETGISVAENPEQSPSSGHTSPGKRTPGPPTFKPVFNQRPKISGKDSKYSHPPHWKKETIHELPFPGVLPQADYGRSSASMPIPIDDVVSFPPLPQRQHTSDWQVPPADITTPFQTPAQELPNIFLRHPSSSKSVPLRNDSSEEEEDENKLYKYGIDATIGPSVSRMSATAPPTPTPVIKTTLWGTDEPPVYGPQQQRRRSSAMPQGNILKNKLSNSRIGSSIGASSGARRKSSTRADHIRIVDKQIEKEEGRAPWRKARKDSGYPGLAPPSSDEGSDMSVEDAEEMHERDPLLQKGKDKIKTGMVLQLPTTIRKKPSGSAERLKRIVGARVTEENEDQLERERKVWRQEKARSPSPTRTTFRQVEKRPVMPNLGCGRADCARSSCGNNHFRSATPGCHTSRPNSPVKKQASSDGSIFSIERTKTGTYILKNGE